MAFYPGVKEDVLTVGDLRVTIYDSRRDDAEHTIVLCHGTGGTAEGNFWALFPMLAMRHRVVAFDFADPADPVADRELYVEQVLAVIRAAGKGEPVHVLGYSFGAVVAAQAAARASDDVRTLTLVAGWLKTDAQQRLRNDIWFSLRDSEHPALAEFSVFVQYSQQYINSRLPHELADEIEKVRTGADRSAKMRFNRTVDIAEEVTDITAPTLVIGCRHDQMVPLRHSHLLFGAIPDARLVEIEAGHGVMTERPSEVFVIVDEFVRAPHATPAGGVLENAHA